MCITVLDKLSKKNTQMTWKIMFDVNKYFFMCNCDMINPVVDPGGGAPGMHLRSRYKFVHFHSVFGSNFCKIIGCSTPLGVSAPHWEILDLPLQLHVFSLDFIIDRILCLFV